MCLVSIPIRKLGFTGSMLEYLEVASFNNLFTQMNIILQQQKQSVISGHHHEFVMINDIELPPNRSRPSINKTIGPKCSSTKLSS